MAGNKISVVIGTAGQLRKFEFDPASEILSDKGSTPLKLTGAAGWIDLTATGLEVFDFDPTTSAAATRKMFTTVGGMAHLKVAQDMGEWAILAPSYSNAQLGYYRLSYDLNTFKNVQTANFGTGAKSHSVAYDAKRKLVFTANMGLGEVEIHQLSMTGLTAVGKIALLRARSAVYDGIYNKLYVMTEGNTGNSYLKVYDIQQAAGGLVTATEIGSVPAANSGSNISINHTHNFIAAGVRSGSTVMIVPLTSDGKVDSARQNYNVQLSVSQPRSLQLSEDGKYLFVTPDQSGTAVDLVVYRLNIQANHQVQSATKLTEVDAGATNFRCLLVIP